MAGIKLGFPFNKPGKHGKRSDSHLTNPESMEVIPSFSLPDFPHYSEFVKWESKLSKELRAMTPDSSESMESIPSIGFPGFLDFPTYSGFVKWESELSQESLE